MKRSTILILSAVLIAAVLSGCVQETSEIGAPGGAPQPDAAPPAAATPDAAQPAPASEVTHYSASAPPMITNWKYVSYRNLSISSAPALNQTARVTYSIIPDRDIEILSVGIHIPEGFVFVDADDAKLKTYTSTFVRHSAFWTPANLSKDKMYQLNATIKAVKTGNWTISTFGGNEEVYVSVSEDSAYISDKPFPKPPSIAGVWNRSEFEKIRANMTITPSRPSKYNLTPRPGNISDIKPLDLWWNGTGWERSN